jgi:hypothetical protein
MKISTLCKNVKNLQVKWNLELEPRNLKTREGRYTLRIR